MTSFNDGIEAAADKLKELATSLRKYGYSEKAEVLEEVAIPISALKRPEPSEAVENVGGDPELCEIQAKELLTLLDMACGGSLKIRAALKAMEGE